MFIRYTIYRNEEREDIILEPGLWDKGTERHQDLLPQCHHAQLRVSPRTVNSVTTHSQECHHAQQTEQTLKSFQTCVTSPSHSSHPTFISIRHTVYRTKELGERLVKQRDWSVISVIIKGETPPILISLPPVTHLYPLQLRQAHSLQEQEKNSVRNLVTDLWSTKIERESNIQKREEERRETAEGQFPR